VSREPSARGRWWWALLATLVWHLIVFSILQWWAPWESFESEPTHFEPIQMVFAPTPDDSGARDEDEPSEFSELPEDRADLAPEDPDFISNVDSRARDRATGDETTDLPELQGESEAPHVGMSPDVASPPVDDGSGQEESVTDTGDPEAADLEASAETGADGTKILPADPRKSQDGRRGRPAPDRDRAGRPFPTVPPLAQTVGPAISDLRQQEMRHPMGNVPLFGDVSMSTVAWQWAPWLQQFQRNFYRNWINFVPYAYRIGVIHGRQVVEVEVAKDGTLLAIEVQARDGHASLEEASLANLRSFAPYGPLSEDGSFPDPTLRLQVTIVYPDF
jgi:Gram-negative bacterial TonB protein C-terminal